MFSLAALPGSAAIEYPDRHSIDTSDSVISYWAMADLRYSDAGNYHYTEINANHDRYAYLLVYGKNTITHF